MVQGPTAISEWSQAYAQPVMRLAVAAMLPCRQAPSRMPSQPCSKTHSSACALRRFDAFERWPRVTSSPTSRARAPERLLDPGCAILGILVLFYYLRLHRRPEGPNTTDHRAVDSPIGMKCAKRFGPGSILRPGLHQSIVHHRLPEAPHHHHGKHRHSRR